MKSKKEVLIAKGKPSFKVGRNKRRCGQTQCGYFLQGNCRACETCKSEPYVINTRCQRCLACENIPNVLRWNDGNEKIKEQILQQKKIKEMLERLMQEEEGDIIAIPILPK